jgi:serine/threonine protein kinase
MDTDHSDDMKEQSHLELEHLFDLAEEQLRQNHFDSPLLEELASINERYTEPQLIGEGGMKKIFRVLDEMTQKEVALAKLKEGRRQQDVDALIKEARLTALLDHPHIIKIFDIGIDQHDSPFFTMELKLGDSLQTIIDQCSHRSQTPGQAHQNDFQLYDRLMIFVKICEAISYAHAQGVLHLDLKPANIQIGHYGEVLVCDWGSGMVMASTQQQTERGMATNRNSNESPHEKRNHTSETSRLQSDLLNHMTLKGQIKGTPGYMAPEQIQKSQAYHECTDIYALGGILYALITLSDPLEEKELSKVLDKTCSLGPVSPETRFPQQKWDKGLMAITMKALEQKPRDRYAQVQDLKNDVIALLDGYSPLAENASLWRGVQLLLRRNAKVCWTLLLACICLILISGVYIRHLNLSRQQAQLHAQLALMEKNKSEALLGQLLDERQFLMDINQEGHDYLKKMVYEFTDLKAMEQPERYLNKSLNYLNRLIEVNPNDAWSIMQRGYVYFLMQKFPLASKDFHLFSNFRKNDQEISDLMELSDRYQNLLETHQSLLSPNHMGRLLSELSTRPNRKAQIILMLQYDAQKRHSLKDHSEIVRLTLQHFNPAWDSSGFAFDPIHKKLHLSGHGLKVLSFSQGKFYLAEMPKIKRRISLLNSLGCRELILKDMTLVNLDILGDIKLKTLDIRGLKKLGPKAKFHFKNINEILR